MTGYRRINEQDRESILIYLNTGDRQSAIAAKLGDTQPTISRELKKGLYKGMYNPYLAQRNTNARLQSRKPELKINKQTWSIIESHLAIRWSPFQIASFLHSNPNDAKVVSVSEKTIYNYLHFHMKGELQKLAVHELRQKGKLRKALSNSQRIMP